MTEEHLFFCIQPDEYACECYCPKCYDEALPRGYRCICEACGCKDEEAG